MESRDLRELPLFIPLTKEALQYWGVPYSRETIWRHRSSGGFLSKYTIKKGRRIFFALRDFFKDLEAEYRKKQRG